MDQLTVTVLKEMLRERGLSVSGNKAELVERLKGYDDEQDLVPGVSVRPEDSVSQTSGRSRISRGSGSSIQSRISERRIMEAASKAGLMAKEAKLAELQQLEQEELKMRQRKERLKIEAELAEVEARNQVLENFEEGSSASGPRSQYTWCEPKVKPTKKVEVDTEVINQDDLLKTLVAFNLKGLMPKAEIQKFSGDVTQYRGFIRSFDSIISSKLTNGEEKLNYLVQFTIGQPRDIVRACMHMEPEKGYVEARALLEKRYGNPERLATAYVEKILTWPEVKAEEVERLDEFAVVLRGCKNAIERVAFGKGELENPKTIRQILKKLPYNMQERFRRKVDDIAETRQRSVEFGDFVIFVEDEARIASNPLFGRHLFRESSDKKDLRRRDSKEEPVEKRNVRCNLAKEEKLKCWFCDGKHMLEDCSELPKKDHKEKIEFVAENGLCFACLRPGHHSRGCAQRKRCNICKGIHPTVLHRDKELSMSTEVALESVGDHKQTCAKINKSEPFRMSVVPVKVRIGNQRPIVTYAFLDNGSSATFCSKNLMARLGLKGDNEDPISLDIATIHKSATVKCDLIRGLLVSDLEENCSIAVPPVYVVDELPACQDDIIKNADLQNYDNLRNLEVPELDEEIGILIGANVPQAMEPWEVIHALKEGDPFAIRTRLGWVVCGAPCASYGSRLGVNCIKLKDLKLEKLLVQIYEKDFADVNSSKQGISEEDRLWMKIVEEGCVFTEEGRYEVPLPLRKNFYLPYNKESALRRVLSLKKRLVKDERYKKEYCDFMDEMISNKYAEEVPSNGGTGKYSWFIPHFGVYHPRKPGKIRVVFDCAAKFKGISLNDALLQGPDLTSSLGTVLCRFRKGRVAYMADIEKMFYQVAVPERQRNYLKFLWWKDKNLNGEPLEFRMTVHLFGACSSPSVANYALQRTVLDHGEQYGTDVSETVWKNFYVDDCLKSLDSEKALISNAEGVRKLCARGGFSLKKFVSPSKCVVQAIPIDALGKESQDLLNSSACNEVTALGLGWRLEDDCLKISFQDGQFPTTKRMLLGKIARIFDPLGILSPLILKGRLILQDLCRSNVDWDEEFNSDVFKQVCQWCEVLEYASDICIERSYVPRSFGDYRVAQLHHFSDASVYAYGIVSYLRFVDEKGSIHVSFLYGRARLAPLKAITIPRLELSAATLAVKVNEMLQEALDIPVESTTFWTDSTTVLRYIRNETTRFQLFVANRLSVIKDGSTASQWRYVNSDLNPADDASRGVQSERWLCGPDFLRHKESEWPTNPRNLDSSHAGLEVKKSSICSRIELISSPTRRLINHFSQWIKLIKAVAWWLRFKRHLLSKGNDQGHGFLMPEDLALAEVVIINFVQCESFEKEIRTLQESDQVNKNSSLRKLNPVLLNGCLRVGGRLGRLEGLSEDEKHPIIVPYRHHVTDLIIQDCHIRTGHMGRSAVLSALRKRYWVIKGSAAVRRVIGACVKCRKLYSCPMEQQMANIPPDRGVETKPPFTCTGVDCFGPFYVKQGRSQMKRYGVIFTCLTIRAIHLEVAVDLTTSSFINCLRRFLARRGSVEIIRCDCGTNFVGAEREIHNSMKEWNQDKLREELLQRRIQWIFNPPQGSHFGGVWERQIRTVRKILSSVAQLQNMTDDILHTLFCEVEFMVNSRPLTPATGDPYSVPLSPNQLLTLKGDAPISVWGKFTAKDGYANRRWRQVQYLTDVFWKRWRNEYLLSLQERSKWSAKRRNLQEGDIVMVVDQSVPRCHWPLARVEAVKFDGDGLVRRAAVRCNGAVLERPLSKLVMVLEGNL